MKREDAITVTRWLLEEFDAISKDPAHAEKPWDERAMLASERFVERAKKNPNWNGSNDYGDGVLQFAKHVARDLSGWHTYQKSERIHAPHRPKPKMS